MTGNLAKDGFDFPATFLSPRVHQLISQLAIAESSCNASHLSGGSDETRFLLPDYTVKWEELASVIPDSANIANNSMDYFSECVHIFSPAFLQVQAELSKMSLIHFEKVYREYLKWTGREQVFVGCFKLLLDADSSATSSLLLMTSALERALGDVYLLHSSPCPSMLKDVLVSEELRAAFGVLPLTILRILIGPPTSLNLRNVVWHGFAAPGEIHRGYVFFLLILIPSLGKLLQVRQLSMDKIKHREDVVLEEGFCNCFPSLINNLSLPSVSDSIVSVLTSSTFIPPAMHQYWTEALKHLQENNYEIAVALLLSQLEHSLRCVFTKVNNCTERMLTAESSVLYTTLDEILSKHLSDNKENMVRHAMGEGALNMLFDLLVYPEGPRLRDRLSHGEISFKNIGKNMANCVLCICSVCALKYGQSQRMLQSIQLKDIQIVQDLMMLAEEYESRYHPICLLKSEIVAAVSKVNGWKQISTVVENRENPVPEKNLFTTSIQKDDVQDLCSKISESICDPMHAKKLVYRFVFHPLDLSNTDQASKDSGFLDSAYSKMEPGCSNHDRDLDQGTVISKNYPDNNETRTTCNDCGTELRACVNDLSCHGNTENSFSSRDKYGCHACDLQRCGSSTQRDKPGCHGNDSQKSGSSCAYRDISDCHACDSQKFASSASTFCKPKCNCDTKTCQFSMDMCNLESKCEIGFCDIYKSNTDYRLEEILFILKKPHCTLYRWDNKKSLEKEKLSDQELVGCLRQVVSQVQQASDNIVMVAKLREEQWKKKELRSRQRKTYARLISSLPILSITLRLVLMVVIFFWNKLDEFDNYSVQQQIKIGRYSKVMLKFCENLAVYSNVEKNKWDESCKLASEFIEKTVNVFKTL